MGGGGGVMILLIFFFFWGGGSVQNWTSFRGHFNVFKGLFLRYMYRMWIFLGVAKNSNIVLGCLIFLIFLGRYKR